MRQLSSRCTGSAATAALPGVTMRSGAPRGEMRCCRFRRGILDPDTAVVAARRPPAARRSIPAQHGHHAPAPPQRDENSSFRKLQQDVRGNRKTDRGEFNSARAPASAGERHVVEIDRYLHSSGSAWERSVRVRAIADSHIAIASVAGDRALIEAAKLALKDARESIGRANRLIRDA